MALLNGKYRLVSSENFEDYMKAIGVPDNLLKLGNDSKAETAIKQDGENYMISLTASGRTVELTFKLGVEFDEVTPHGTAVKTIVQRDGDKLTQTQKGAMESVIIREFIGDELKVTLTAGSVTSVRGYKKYE